MSDHDLLDLYRRVIKARQADIEERKALLFDKAEEVLNALLDNENLSEQELEILIDRKDLSVEIIHRLGGDNRILSSYGLKKSLLLNPKTPASISLKYIGQLFTFDVVSIMLVPFVPPEVKVAGEEQLCRKLTQLSLGEKLTLAKRTNGERLLTLLLDDGSKEVVSSVLMNPFLKERIICTAIRKATVKPHLIELLATNGKWSCRYDIRYALLRTRHLTLGLALNFLQGMIAKDLRDLSNDPQVSIQVRNYIKSNLTKLSNEKKKSF
ncbi:MAG: hypothetical protein JNM06_18770 [Blastocatellia bacterium]|nr:hypothetical protein [Blastocatellia bacterium]MBN8724797.1 hypothetical protein [Acidobacteriota bacterium]